MFFVHVESRDDILMLFPQLQSPLRIAFQVDTFKTLYIYDGEDLPSHLETKGIGTKGGILRRAGF